MDISKFLKDLKLNKIRNIIIYVSFILLVISLIFPLQSRENAIVQKQCLSFLIYGLFLWLLEHLALIFGEDRTSDEQMMILVLWIVLAILGFAVTFEIAFGEKITDIIFSMF